MISDALEIAAYAFGAAMLFKLANELRADRRARKARRERQSDGAG